MSMPLIFETLILCRILVYIFITWNNIFLCFQNCYKSKKSEQKQNAKYLKGEIV